MQRPWGHGGSAVNGSILRTFRPIHHVEGHILKDSLRSDEFQVDSNPVFGSYLPTPVDIIGVDLPPPHTE
jgi:hypothetical protein